jgi:hypothetical protein
MNNQAIRMDGFQNIAVRRLGLNSVLLSAGILLAVWRFDF